MNLKASFGLAAATLFAGSSMVVAPANAQRRASGAVSAGVAHARPAPVPVHAVASHPAAIRRSTLGYRSSASHPIAHPPVHIGSPHRVSGAPPQFVPSGRELAVVFWGGVPYYYTPDDSGAPVDNSGSVASADQNQDQGQQEAEAGSSQTPSDEYASESSAEAQEPVRDVGQFTLILQNGQRLEAVAFSHINDDIVYITSDGNRRSFPATDLNASATVQINQERGTPLQLPL
jgi:hypothetical protein